MVMMRLTRMMRIMRIMGLVRVMRIMLLTTKMMRMGMAYPNWRSPQQDTLELRFTRM